VIALGHVRDIERQETTEYGALLEECERFCSIAEQLNCPNVQLLTGPLGPGHGKEDPYKGLTGRPWPEMRKLTAKNLAALADIGKQHGVGFYLEPISWAPLHSLQQGLEVIDEAGQDNVGIMIDFWHMWITGTTPDDIAKLDKNVINGVHFCDSLPRSGQPISHKQREVWPGGGSIPLKEWIEAVKATGYDGWWSPELHSPKHWEMDPWEVALNLRELLRILYL
jgi:sugar phosphate isomerase/epimerase